jgi:hypothetical protein
MKQLGLGIIVATGLTLPAFGQEVFNPPHGGYVLNSIDNNSRTEISKKSDPYCHWKFILGDWRRH